MDWAAAGCCQSGRFLPVISGKPEIERGIPAIRVAGTSLVFSGDRR